MAATMYTPVPSVRLSVRLSILVSGVAGGLWLCACLLSNNDSQHGLGRSVLQSVRPRYTTGRAPKDLCMPEAVPGYAQVEKSWGAKQTALKGTANDVELIRVLSRDAVGARGGAQQDPRWVARVSVSPCEPLAVLPPFSSVSVSRLRFRLRRISARCCWAARPVPPGPTRDGWMTSWLRSRSRSHPDGWVTLVDGRVPPVGGIVAPLLQPKPAQARLTTVDLHRDSLKCVHTTLGVQADRRFVGRVPALRPRSYLSALHMACRPTARRTSACSAALDSR